MNEILKTYHMKPRSMNKSPFFLDQNGMSTIDTVMILAMLGIAVLLFLLPGKAWLILGGAVIAFIFWVFWSSSRDWNERCMRLKESYEKGELPRVNYVANVGEKFFRKHHGELPPEEDEQ